MFNRTTHWENIYDTKALTEVSWYQQKPTTSLEFIERTKISFDEAIIDIGGGDSLLVDYLLELGYTNVSVLDISSKAIERAKKRLGANAEKVKWIVSDITDFKPTEKYKVWHDRAAFHFLTEPNDVAIYQKTISNALNEGGFAIVGTFSENGPKKCSGIEIKQYSTSELTEIFNSHFNKIKCENTDHTTPSNSIQNFNFCLFQKK
jgi:2-polyprenyl-3-methyl-5-hydroxy-6-metoxy-1,4-benzoquinol methylase